VKTKIVIILSILLSFTACNYNIQNKQQEKAENGITIHRFDRLESRYLTTGDYSALQQMNTDYPRQTRLLLEDVLALGEVSDASINSRFLSLFQDTLLQAIITDVGLQYSDVKDLNKQLTEAFNKLKKFLPSINIPLVYTQITALNQSIVVGDSIIGISLDKYLGVDYPLYKRYYNEQQVSTMNREHIVPDCICFYLLSLYPLEKFETSTQEERDLHMGKIMWVANKAIGKRIFNNSNVTAVENYVKKLGKVKVADLLNTEETELVK